MDAVYLFHDLYGYLMEMSPDIADFIAAFGGGADSTATIERFAPRFEGADPRQFAEVLAAHAVLVPPDEDIHAVGNYGSELAISIHVYGADIGILGTSIRRRYDQPVSGR